MELGQSTHKVPRPVKAEVESRNCLRGPGEPVMRPCLARGMGPGSSVLTSFASITPAVAEGTCVGAGPSFSASPAWRLPGGLCTL